MATLYTTHPGSMLASLANLQQLANAVFGLFNTAGLVRSSDTGQTEVSAMVALSSTVSTGGFQIWRFNDALQATSPVFIKIEFGTTSWSNGYQAVFVTVGAGTDGAGTITNVLIPRTTIPQAASSAPGSYLSGASNRIAMALWSASQSVNTCVAFSLERSKDNNGADTADGIIFNSWCSAAKTSYYATFSGVQKGAMSNFAIPGNIAMGSLANSAITYLLPIYPIGLSGPVNSGLGALCYYGADIAAMNAIPVNIYGANHVYLPLGGAVSAIGSYTGSSLAMLYE